LSEDLESGTSFEFSMLEEGIQESSPTAARSKSSTVAGGGKKKKKDGKGKWDDDKDDELLSSQATATAPPQQHGVLEGDEVGEAEAAPGGVAEGDEKVTKFAKWLRTACGITDVADTYAAALVELGADEVSDLKDVDDEEWPKVSTPIDPIAPVSRTDPGESCVA
jgi:hypothetical protein